jgi:mono/diheme cytochrome c family protein
MVTKLAGPIRCDRLWLECYNRPACAAIAGLLTFSVMAETASYASRFQDGGRQTTMRISKVAPWVLLVVIVAGIDVAILVRRGFSTKDQPSAFETSIARAARDLSIPGSAKAMKNPYPATAENVHSGLEHFADHCAICHANDGSGQTEMGPNFYPKAPDMRLAQTQNLTDGEIFYIINNGVRLTGMPGWGGSHGSDDTWKLVLFIRHLPKLSAAEKEDMEEFNPKSADDDKHGR